MVCKMLKINTAFAEMLVCFFFLIVMFEGLQKCPMAEVQGADGSNSLPHAPHILPGLLQKAGLFSCASTTFPYAKPQHLEKRPINTEI